MMKSLIVTLLLSASAFGGTHAITRTGVGTGNDWNSPAGPSALAGSSPVRGDTYCIAGDSTAYSALTLSKAVSGTSVITLQSAVSTACQALAGWSSSLTANQAVFPTITITTNFWTLDGVSRNTDWISGYNIKVNNSITPTNGALNLSGKSNINVQYVEFQGDGLNTGHCNRLYYNPTGGSNFLILNNYFHDSSGTPIIWGLLSGITFTGNVVTRYDSTPTCHAESIADEHSSSVTIAQNIFSDEGGGSTDTATGSIVELKRTTLGTADSWNIYSNLFFLSNGNPYSRKGFGNGVIACINGQLCTNWSIMGNTVAYYTLGLSVRWIETSTAASGSTFTVKNNLSIGNTPTAAYNVGTGVTVTTSDNGFGVGETFNASETNVHSNVANIFINNVLNNFNLASASPAGATLASPFAIDLTGAARGTNCNSGFCLGAYELGGSPPFHLTVADSGHSTATGSVTAPDGTNCALPGHTGTCSTNHSALDSVTLTATATTGGFGGWGGACSGLASTCTVVFGGTDIAVTAEFDATPTVSLVPSPLNINVGQSTTLTFSGTNATGCTLQDGLGGFYSATSGTLISGTAVLTPTVTTAYTYVCTTVAGSSTTSVTVNVNGFSTGSISIGGATSQ